VNGETLAAIMGCPLARAEAWAPHLDGAMSRYDINTVKRQAAFLAQVGHESGRLRYVREIGSQQYLDRYDTGKLAARLGNTPDNDHDGARYCGRGLIQITGRENYLKCGEALGLDLIETPELLETPKYAALSAAWFWDSRHLNALADVGDMDRITRKINGGTNGLPDRLALYAKANEVLA
jgi:putative chitinase